MREGLVMDAVNDIVVACYRGFTERYCHDLDMDPKGVAERFREQMECDKEG